MRILGISPLDKDSTVSFMEDGRVLFACGEERLSRVKLQDGFPHRALRLGLEKTGWDPSSIDTVAYAFFDGDEEARLIKEAYDEDGRVHRRNCTSSSLTTLRKVSVNGYAVDRAHEIPGIPTPDAEFMVRKPWLKRKIYDSVVSNSRLDWETHRHFFREWVKVAIADHQRWARELDAGLAQYGLQSKLRRFHHHDTHAANSFFASGYDTALLVTLDGYGSGCCGGVYVGDDSGLRPLHRFAFPNSLGIFYEHVTSGLGFKAGRHEGKIVGLAAYGDPEHLRSVLLERFECEDGDLRIRAGMNAYFTRALAQRFAKRDIAAAYQKVLEEVTQLVVGFWVNKTGLSNVAVSGGVHANVKLNQRIHELEGVDSVFVYPNMGDGGCGTGAALLAFGAEAQRAKSFDTVYFGPDYTDSEIRTALIAEGLTGEPIADIEEQVADLLTQNYIVARFHGRMEYGPRALGNRSILYAASDPDVNQWLNHQLGRTEFMPFAPAVLSEHAHDLFFDIDGCEKTAEFMTVTFNCKQQMKDQCPAAVHIDGTARPQLVSPKTNPSFYRILKAYYDRTGIPATINTSFNMHEEPIVCSPADAVRAFLQGSIDYLAIGNFLIPHPNLRDIQQARRQTAELQTAS